MRHVHRREAGAALVLVLLGIFILMAVGVFIILSVDRNTDLRSAFQRNVAGFNAAEAGLNVGAAQVLTAMQGFSLPSNCSPQAFTLNGRTVTYTLSVPGNAPGDCTPNTTVVTEPDGPYAGLNAIVHQYNLASRATNRLGYTEASITNQFLANLIPVFQFASFYSGNLEILPSPPMVINGRVHTNGNLYLNSESCGAPITAGLNILGKITTVGKLFRGRLDADLAANNVYISLDGTPGNMQVLGAAAPGDAGCAGGGTRLVGATEIATFPGRITTGISGITLPGVDSLLCTPWGVAACSGSGGVYWQNANLRIVLDATTTEGFDGSTCNPTASATAPCLYPIEVVDAAGNRDVARTAQLRNLMQIGAITYSDVPNSTADWDCNADNGCESNPTAGYNVGSSYAKTGSLNYALSFPQSPAFGCGTTRTPRTQINPNGSNFCQDYRYGGFYNWREKKPILMLNIDWMKVEEYNRANGNVFFDPNTTTNGGVVVFLSVRGPNSARGNNYGVRIYDAARLPRDDSNTGVTFATDDAAYVTGSFNCPAADFSGGDSVPAACGSAQRPSSVIADTMNVLSCAWVPAAACQGPAGGFLTNQDQWDQVCGLVTGGCRPVDEASTMSSGTTPTGSSCSGGGCTTQTTVVNAAFLAGNDTTVGGLYSGGLENYPRFHEDWQGGGTHKFWYQGSFVSLDVPQHSCFSVVQNGVADDAVFSCNNYSFGSQGFWGAQRYVPPPRRWFYDVSFNNSTNLPPLTPRFVFLKLVYFTQVFQ